MNNQAIVDDLKFALSEKEAERNLAVCPSSYASWNELLSDIQRLKDEIKNLEKEPVHKLPRSCETGVCGKCPGCLNNAYNVSDMLAQQLVDAQANFKSASEDWGKVVTERDQLIEAAEHAIPESAHPKKKTASNWASKILELGGDRRDSYGENERLRDRLAAALQHNRLIKKELDRLVMLSGKGVVS